MSIGRVLGGGVLCVVACGTFTGCNSGDSGPGIVYDPCQALVIVPDPTSTSVEHDGAALAVALWQKAASLPLTLDASEKAPELPVRFQSAALAFRGLYDAEHAIVFVNSGLTDEHELGVTIAHEIGHAFGLVHVAPDVRPSLMNPGNLTVEPTASDVQVLASSWGRCVAAN